MTDTIQKVFFDNNIMELKANNWKNMFNIEQFENNKTLVWIKVKVQN